MSWEDNRLVVGEDADIGGSVFLEWKDDNMPQIQAMAFRGLVNKPAFEFTKVPSKNFPNKCSIITTSF